VLYGVMFCCVPYFGSIILVKMDTFPKLSAPRDNYPVGASFFLAAYPNFLAFGKPSADYSDFHFLPQSYIKISPANYSDWYKAICDILTVFYKDSDISSGVVVEQKDFPMYSIQWEKDLNTCFVIKFENATYNSKFTLTPMDIYDLVKGFYYMLLKPFCLPYFVDWAIINLFEENHLKKFKTSKSISSCIEVVENLDISLSESQIVRVKENIIRLKPYLKLKCDLLEIMVLEKEQHSP